MNVPRSFIHNSRQAAASLAIAIAFLTAGGCQLLGAIAGKAVGDPPVVARYAPRKVTTLVLVERAPGAAADDVSVEDVQRLVILDWRNHNLAPVADITPLEQLRSTHPDRFHRMSITSLGKLVGAEQVLYIDVSESRSETAMGSDMSRAQASARVRLVDVKTGNSLWPTDSTDGFPVDAETKYTATPTEEITPAKIQTQTHETLARNIVRLFRTYRPQEEGDEPQPLD